MKLDLLILKNLQKHPYNDELTHDVLKALITTVLNYEDKHFATAPDSVKMAINTLKELKILIDDEPVSQQLNS
jgi:hypothetical protein